MIRLTYSVIAFAFVTALAGCKTDSQLRNDQARAYVASHAELDPRTASAISSNRIHKGMNKEQVIAAWGQPVYVQQFNKGIEYWYFDCIWPHFCDGLSIGQNAEDQYKTRALFRHGKVIDVED